MSDALLDYSSWSFQLIFLLAVLYLVIGLIRPSSVMATKRRTIVIAAVVVVLLASTAFYIAVRPFDGAPDGPASLDTEPQPPQSPPALP